MRCQKILALLLDWKSSRRVSADRVQNSSDFSGDGLRGGECVNKSKLLAVHSRQSVEQIVLLNEIIGWSWIIVSSCLGLDIDFWSNHFLLVCTSLIAVRPTTPPVFCFAFGPLSPRTEGFFPQLLSLRKWFHDLVTPYMPGPVVLGNKTQAISILIVPRDKVAAEWPRSLHSD